MRRFLISFLALPVALLVAVGPVAADTTGGGNGTHFGSFTETCSTSGGRQVCTDTSIYVDPNGDGTSSACLDIFAYSQSSTGRFSFISDQFGCTSDVTLTVGSDYSVSLASTVIPMQTCKAHKRNCSGSTDATVSASDHLVGDISKTTTRSTTVSGGFIYQTATNETFGELAGTMTINGSTVAEDGYLDIIDESSTVRCK